MSYVEFNFYLFLLILLVLYFSVPKSAQKYVLFIGSIIFYLYSGAENLIYVMFTAISTFLIGILLEDKRKKYILWIGIISNIGLLVLIKFGSGIMNIFEKYNVFQENYVFSIVMPLGMSFYTLQAVGYIIDVYQEKYDAERNLFKYVASLIYFPTIVQGPITRYNEVREKIWMYHPFEYERVKFGGQLMIWGLLKKLVIANRIALYVDAVFDNYVDYSGALVLIACCLYSVQIYADFSGCVDICRGISQMLGIELVDNFHSPYFATTIAEFWRRWHMSLSSWLRDYVYFPLGGSKGKNHKKYANIVIVFLVSGLWHGVGFQYIVWGMLHAGYQIIQRAIVPFKEKVAAYMKLSNENNGYIWYRRMVNFMLVTFAWIFFRAPNVNAALHIIKSVFCDLGDFTMFKQIGISSVEVYMIIAGCIVIFIVSALQEQYAIRIKISRFPIGLRWSLYMISIFTILIYGVYGSGYNLSNFIYMQF